jgi:membrane-anchored protein YejM (alkaline phosphatase superfamily)
MRWVFLVAKSLAMGVLAIVLSLIVLLVTSSLYEKYVLHLGPNEAVG